MERRTRRLTAIMRCVACASVVQFPAFASLTASSWWLIQTDTMVPFPRTIRYLFLHLPAAAAFVKHSSSATPFSTMRRDSLCRMRGLRRASLTLPLPSARLMTSQWYNDPDLERDRSHVLENDLKCATSSDAKYVLVSKKNGFYYQKALEKSLVEPLYLSYAEIRDIFGAELIPDMLEDPRNKSSLLAWIGRKQGADFWTLFLSQEDEPDNLFDSLRSSKLHVDGKEVQASPLREFGDLLELVNDAGILATANGLIEFHKSHPFCNRCGSATLPVKAGASRRCTNCRASTYPRIDVASIMLITSPCEQYALLGRKKNWPKGRYSTLAGFTEVGETIEASCVREVMEESGVAVDPRSVEFVCSQPWPFPRSLMVGFRAKALSTTNDAVEGDPPAELPVVDNSIEELEDVQWFHKEFVSARLDRGYYSTLQFDPKGSEEEFHVPGKASLARVLISDWATS